MVRHRLLAWGAAAILLMSGLALWYHAVIKVFKLDSISLKADLGPLAMLMLTSGGWWWGFPIVALILTIVAMRNRQSWVAAKFVRLQLLLSGLALGPTLLVFLGLFLSIFAPNSLI